MKNKDKIYAGYESGLDIVDIRMNGNKLGTNNT